MSTVRTIIAAALLALLSLGCGESGPYSVGSIAALKPPAHDHREHLSKSDVDRINANLKHHRNIVPEDMLSWPPDHQCAPGQQVIAAVAQAPSPAIPGTVWMNPPISAGPVVSANGHLAVAGQRVTFFAVNFDAEAIFSIIQQGQVNAANQAIVSRHLDNLLAMGVRAVRIHALDAWFSPIFSPGTTRQLDSLHLQALDWFLAQLEQRNIRYVVDLHFARKLTGADVPPWPSPLFAECTAQSYLGAPIGFMTPWMFYDDGLMALTREYCGQLLGHVNQYTGTAIGKSNALIAVLLENEISLTKTAAWGYGAHPLLNAAFNADFAAWCTANGITKAGNIEHAQYAAWKETQVFGAYAAYVRTLTSALIIAQPYFGNGPYSMLVAPYAVGDAIDFHFYSRYAATDTNGFLNGLTPTDARPRSAAVMGGCSWTNGGKPLPLICTEYNGVMQCCGLPVDPPAERSQVIAAFVQAAIAQDVDLIALYSYAHNQLYADGSPAAIPGPYDARCDPVILQNVQAQAAAFQAPRPAVTPVQVTPTGGVYGATVAGKWQQFGPYTDQQALYPVKAGTPVKVLAP